MHPGLPHFYPITTDKRHQGATKRHTTT